MLKVGSARPEYFNMDQPIYPIWWSTILSKQITKNYGKIMIHRIHSLWLETSIWCDSMEYWWSY